MVALGGSGVKRGFAGSKKGCKGKEYVGYLEGVRGQSGILMLKFLDSAKVKR